MPTYQRPPTESAPSNPSFVLTGPALAGRESGTGGLVSIPLAAGLNIVNGVLTVTGGGGGGGGGGVTSVGLSAPTGFSVAGTPVTGSGTLALSFASGYSLPTTAKQGQWDQAYLDLGQAREWSADTISQAEAEAGTATTRRAFTAVRVFQAVAAWWAGSAAKAKLDGIASAATANSTDAQLRDRGTHTGTQPATTITGLSTVATSGAYGDLSGRPDLALKADLVNGLVPASQLPGFVDDVLEFANLVAFPATGEAGKLYIALNTNKQYRWAGSTYQEINPSPGSTDAIPEGSVNLYHTTLRAAAAAPVQSVAGKTGNVTLAVGDVANAVATTDNRLSDARTPTAHNQAWGTITGTPTTLGGYGITDAFNPATPGTIGGTTPGAGSFTSLLATTRLGLPSGAPASPAARDLYQVADTLRYRDSGGIERLLLNATDNLANLVNTATARTNLGAIGTVTTGITGAEQITNIISISQANYDAIPTKNAQTLYVISG